MTRCTFNSYYKQKNETITNAGTPIKKEYQLYVTEDGREELQEVGETNLQDYIQSYAQSVDINTILARFQNGDLDAINAIQGFYADISDMPVTMSEMLNINMRGKEYFDSLPAEIKEKFDNNYIDFINHPEKFNEIVEPVASNDIEVTNDNEE